MENLRVSPKTDLFIQTALDDAGARGLSNPMDYIVSLWRSDNLECKQVVLESALFWSDVPTLCDEIIQASKVIKGDDYWRFLQSLVDNDRVPFEHRERLASALVDIKSDEAEKLQFVRTFLTMVDRIDSGASAGNAFNLDFAIQTACRIGFTEFLAPLQTLRRCYEQRRKTSYIFDKSTYEFVCMGELLLQKRLTCLHEVVVNAREPNDRRCAAIYCLGCARYAEAMDDLKAIYTRSGWFGFDLKLACLEAIVYADELLNADAFVLQRLQQLSAKGEIRRRWYSYEGGMLLLAVYNLPDLSADLMNQAIHWPQAKNRQLAARALVALERHGHVNAQRKKELGRNYTITAELIASNPAPLSLMSHRTAA